MLLNFVSIIITCIRTTYCDIIAPPTEGGVLDWWQSSVIYEIFPMSFKDSNGDGLGDFRGIIQKLDYLVDIGVNAIWLTPFLESPLKSGGYDVTDYLSVQKRFGTLDDFKDLLYNAHAKNLKIIMDFVPNHTSDEHVWFKKSVDNETDYADYYIWKDATNRDEIMRNNSAIPIVPNNWKRIDGYGEDDSAWIWNGIRKQFYFTQFIQNLPDLNFRNKNVHAEMKNILNYWLELGIDGIRIDALKHVYESKNMENEPVIDETRPADYNNLNHIYTTDQDEVFDLINEWHLILNEFKLKYNRTRIIMTESSSPLNVLFKYYTSGAEIPTNFNLMYYNYLHSPKEYDREIRTWITQMPNGSTFNVVLQNHDKPRFPTSSGTEFIDGLNALSLFLPGVAIVYYGGEIGMEDISDEINFSRSPMQWDNTEYAGFTNNDSKRPWIDVHPDYVTRNVQTESNDPKSYLNFFKSVSRLRQTETLKRGGLATYIFNQTVFVINRFLPGNENYTLVINMDSNSQHVRLTDQVLNLHDFLTVVFGSENSNFSPGNSISTESLTLSPGAAIVLSDSNSHLVTESPLSSSTQSYITIESISSSSIQLYITFKVLLFSLCTIKLWSL